jgi:hypothetical protein
LNRKARQPRPEMSDTALRMDAIRVSKVRLSSTHQQQTLAKSS